MIPVGTVERGTGFSLGAIDMLLDEASEKKPVGPGPEDDVPPVVAAPVSRKGDLWILGAHRLLCGDARTTAGMGRSSTAVLQTIGSAAPSVS
jgi:hypothetical protein